MKCFGKEIEITYSKYFNMVTLFTILVLIFAFVYNIYFVAKCINKINKNQQKIEIILDGIEAKNKPTVINKDELILTNKEFMKDYYTIQADWLNKWFTILAIIIGVFGVMIPVCFVKFLENKEKEMDRIIKDAIKQKKKTKLNVEEMEKKLDEVDEKSRIMDNQLKEVKDYVDKAKALSKIMEAEQKLKDEKYEEAENLYKDAISLNPNNDKEYIGLGKTYLKLKKYDEAKENFLKAIKIKPSCDCYEFLSIIARKDKNYLEAIKLHQNAYDISQDTFSKSFYLSLIACDYSLMEDSIRTNEYIGKAFSTGINKLIKSNCAAALINIKEYKRGIDILKELLIYAHPIDLYNLTEAYIMDGQLENALKVIKKYIQSQNKNIKEGILFDDYSTWKSKLQLYKDDKTAAQILQYMDTLKKIERY